MTRTTSHLRRHLVLGLALIGLGSSCRGGLLPDGGVLLTKGCSADSSCASGVCLASQDCQTCQLDAECAGTSRCGTTVCSAQCTSAASCAAGWGCCKGRCIQPLVDPASCGGCGILCPAAAFCGQGACEAALFRNLCLPGALFVVRDSYPADNNAGRDMATALAASCGIEHPVVDQALEGSGAVDPDTGQPLLLTSVLVAGGGGFGQGLFTWLQQHGAAPVVLGLTGGIATYSRADGRPVVSLAYTSMGPSHDVFVLQVAHAAGGPLVLSAFGYYAGGTTAASWYFVHRVLPTLGTLNDAWMVVEWTDASGDGLPGDTDRWTLVASGR